VRRLAIAAYAWGGGAAFVAALAYFAYTFAVTMAREVPAGTPGAGVSAILFDVALFSVFAAHHTAYARERVKREVARAVTPPLERSTYVWVASLLFILVCAAWRPVAGTLYAHEGVGAWLHGAVVASGIALTAAGALRLKAFDLAGISRARRGEETGTWLVVRWPYTMVRHPIYLAWLLMVFGPAAMTGTRLVFACVSSAYLALAVPLEERLLLKQFGEAYRRYQRQVRWRMVPGVY
jgi:protein-S-isoprenylcysteine O-methyltransferase Ste14